MKDGDGQEHENDPCEPMVNTCREWNKEFARSFNEMVNPIRSVVYGIVFSDGFWSAHKFIGSESLELKLRTWMKWRIDAETVDKNWPALRRAVKESLRYKRQLCVGYIYDAFIRELNVALCCVGVMPV